MFIAGFLTGAVVAVTSVFLGLYWWTGTDNRRFIVHGEDYWDH